MPTHAGKPNVNDVNAFMGKATFAVVFVSVLFLTPFAINNFIQGRPIMGVLAVVVVSVLSLIAWDTSRRGRDYSTVVLGFLLPAVTIFIALAMYRQETIGMIWSFPVVLSLYVMLPEQKAWFANVVFALVVATVSWFLFDPSLSMRFVVSLLMSSVIAAIFVRAIAEQRKALRRLAVVDSLTGVLNRTLMAEALEAASFDELADKSNVVISFDIDHFKRVNDSSGHDAGDDLLRRTGSLLQAHFSEEDWIFRAGGEEFLVLMENCTLEEARQAAERFRRKLEKDPLFSAHGVTVSAGVSDRQAGDTVNSWIKRSDTNMYLAKSNGRNQIVC